MEVLFADLVVGPTVCSWKAQRERTQSTFIFKISECDQDDRKVIKATAITKNIRWETEVMLEKGGNKIL